MLAPRLEVGKPRMLLLTHGDGEERTMQLVGAISSSRRTKDWYSGKIFQKPLH